jgi:hypothetical protein
MAALMAGSLGAGQAARQNAYDNPGNWLCRPGRADACSEPVTATVISADGNLSQHTYRADPNAPIDCFYVYPTVSLQPTPNSDRTAGPEEEHAARNQFARFGSVCRLYAPLYRQVTLAGLRGALRGDSSGINFEVPYQDILDAWNSYLARDNHGRGVVLIGHSQGSTILTHLIASQIEGKPLQARLVSALLLGTDIETPVGRNVGGTFQHIPLCQTQTQIGCVVAYSTYLATQPPGPEGKFGASSSKASVYACVNPAALTGGDKLETDFPAIGEIGRRFGTTFLENPGLLSAECRVNADHSYLAVSIGQGAGSEKVTTALEAIEQHLPGWGLHALDVNIALGNLVDLVAAQAKAWIAEPARNHA